MCKKSVVVLLTKPIAFLTFSLPSASLDVKVPIDKQDDDGGADDGDDDVNYDGDDDYYARISMIMTPIMMMMAVKTTTLMMTMVTYSHYILVHRYSRFYGRKLRLLGKYACRLSGECYANHHQGGEALTSLPLTSI